MRARCTWWVVLLLVGRTHAQVDTLRLPFRALSIEDGLSQGMVNTIVQDRYGFMWFGTKDGLDRYDGYTFTVHHHEPEDSTTVRNNHIHALFEDRQGRLWVGTNAGLDLFDRARETFLHVRIGADGFQRMVQGITQDANGDLWVAHDQGVLKLTFSGEEMNGLPRFTTKNVLSGTCFVSADRHGDIWVGQLDHGGFRIRPHHGGEDRVDSLQLDRDIGNTRIGRGPRDLTGLTVVEDTARGTLYGLHMFGIVRIDPRTGTVRSLLALDSRMGEMRGAHAAVDAKGRLWISVFTGIHRFDPATGTLHRVLPEACDQQQMAFAGRSAFRDRSGLLWLGTTGYGLLTHDERSGRFNTVNSKSCGPLSPTRAGRVLVSFYEGFINEFDPRTRTWPLWIPWKEKVDDPQLRVLSRSPRLPRPDGHGGYWLNHTGMVHYDPVLDKVRRFPHDPAAAAAFPNDVHHEALTLEGDSNIWSGTAGTLCRFDRRTGTYHYFPYPRTRPSDTEQFLNAIHIDPAGVLWLGTSDGVLRFQRPAGGGPAAWTVYTYDVRDSTTLSSNIVYCIQADAHDPAHVLWVGTNGGGFDRFDTRTGRFERFSTADGLPNNVVYGILTDARGRLWMSTNKGIACFDPRHRSFRNYDASDGLQSDEFNRYSFCKLADGTLFFGGVNGFNYFHPDDLLADSTASALRITGIKLINKAVDHRAPGAPLSAPAYMSQGMRIPHSTNMVTFEFATMEFASARDHHYQYKLEGFDPDWISAGTDHSAVYTNLDPGTYTFRVRGDNRDGVWDSTGTAFQLVVLPPWWRTWWAYALYLIALLGGVFAYTRIRTGGLKRQKYVLERTVAQRTAELTQRTVEAEAQRKRAEHSEQVKEQFLANMSHEIRTPMNVIVGMSAVLKRDEHLPAQRTYLDAISSSSEHLLVIVNDILDLSKIEAGQLHLEQVAFEPRAVLAKVLDILRFRANERALVVESVVDPSVPAKVVGDPTRLHQVLMNLVGNAVKFTERGAVTVRVQGRGHQLIFSVTDTGIGIAPDRLPHVFTEFTQAEADHTRKYGGTGLGLAISKRLVEMQGGTIGATSTVGQGSTFTFTIPYGVAQHSVDAISHSPFTHSYSPLRDLHILLAEDNKMNVLVARRQLEDALPGVRIAVAVNGEQAVAMVQQHTYHLVLMDVQMPVMDGYAATRAIRALAGPTARIPILAMTANVMKPHVDKCLEAGMDGFVPKPFTQEQLLEAIAKAMGR